MTNKNKKRNKNRNEKYINRIYITKVDERIFRGEFSVSDYVKYVKLD